MKRWRRIGVVEQSGGDGEEPRVERQLRAAGRGGLRRPETAGGKRRPEERWRWWRGLRGAGRRRLARGRRLRRRSRRGGGGAGGGEREREEERTPLRLLEIDDGHGVSESAEPHENPRRVQFISKQRQGLNSLVSQPQIRAANGCKDTSKKSPMELINEVPPIKVEGRIVACEGDNDPALGHPIEFICLDLKDPAICKYCGLRYVQHDHHH
ncbi:uncharacterized protein A4U43_C10F780 [Asparagus officinalis]|uniref:Zinc finger CHCC-type domain-containing protein n=1 Tax=Asparagus officinalis TaxID=4686 RepID=A0A5P1E2N8_ASPOF|nr:uncharacterized protein A4U43_C10F780 [Asparagus officinalis]